MISKDKQYKTRCGYESIILEIDGCISYAYRNPDLGWQTATTNNKGYYYDSTSPNPLDLIEVKPAKTIWIEVCLFGSEIVVAHHETKKEAEESVAESNLSEQFKHIDLIEKTYEL